MKKEFTTTILNNHITTTSYEWRERWMIFKRPDGTYDDNSRKGLLINFIADLLKCHHV